MGRTKEGTEKRLQGNKQGYDKREEEKEEKETQGKSAFFSIGSRDKK